jgi:hypothetical protein
MCGRTQGEAMNSEISPRVVLFPLDTQHIAQTRLRIREVSLEILGNLYSITENLRDTETVKKLKARNAVLGEERKALKGVLARLTKHQERRRR